MILAWLVIGLVGGWFSMQFHIWSVRRLAPRPSAAALTWLIGGFGVRLGWIALLLIFALRQGLGPGLSAFTGIWLARWIMIARLHKLASLKS